ncbi:hypothetical protein [Snuella lapsa]|uniref:Secreted protein n=1 Tax=Snuella lapsa TaxID=870481 RepID=A0ABP6X3F6_9FLAO
MKKIIKNLGIAFFTLSLFFYSNFDNKSNQSRDFSLSSLLTFNSAKAEEICYYNCDPTPDGSIEAPYTEMCPVWLDYAGEPIFYGNWPTTGIDCDWTMDPSYTCSPYDPC